MEANAYLDRLLEKYTASFDIYRPYTIAEKEYPAYGYFFSLSEKYVISQKANLWSVRTYEHLIVMQTERLTMETIAEVRSLMTDYMEPVLVRKGKKYPEQDHMVSYMTVVVLSEQTPDAAASDAAEHFHFSKNYLLTVRGHSEGHFICVDLEKEQVFCNRPAARMLKTYQQIFDAE